jgi:predicted transposase/invertase (TIGR01784 family)
MEDSQAKNNPHDHLARNVFGRPDVAADFFKAYLPDSIGQKINAEHLEREPDSFIEETLKQSVADLLYHVKDESGEFWLYCLFEHQSQPDRWMPMRLLKYMLRIWDNHLAKYPKARQLPPIIPVVLHHGQNGWTAAKSFEELVSLPKDLKGDILPYLPSFSFPLVDLKNISFEDIRGNVISRLTLMALKATGEDRMEDFWQSAKDLWSDLVKVDSPQEIARVLFRYMFYTDTSIDKQLYQDRVKIIQPKEVSQTAMTLAEQFIAEGIEKGIEKGIKQERKDIILKMNASGLDVDKIVSLTGIPKDEVLQCLASAD